jgi:hypothetical protein
MAQPGHMMRGQRMDYDQDKVDEMVLALLWLTASRVGGATRAWKGFDWDVLDRLHEKGFIGDPKSKSQSLVLTDTGAKRSEELFRQHFGPGA